MDFVSPNVSPLGALVLLTGRKDRSLRLCVDYMSLNAVTIKNKYPLPRIVNLVNQLGGTKVFLRIDIYLGFY